MKNLKAKLRRDGGFTLIEMLIVVAIIAILIAISIPLVGQALERAREATDASNERSFKAELVICHLLGTTDGAELKADKSNQFKHGTTYWYDAANGTIKEGTGTGKYGQGTTAGTDTTARSGQYLKGNVDANGVVTIEWSDSTGLTGSLLNDGSAS